MGNFQTGKDRYAGIDRHISAVAAGVDVYSGIVSRILTLFGSVGCLADTDVMLDGIVYALA